MQTASSALRDSGHGARAVVWAHRITQCSTPLLLIFHRSTLLVVQPLRSSKLTLRHGELICLPINWVVLEVQRLDSFTLSKVVVPLLLWGGNGAW